MAITLQCTCVSNPTLLPRCVPTKFTWHVEQQHWWNGINDFISGLKLWYGDPDDIREVDSIPDHEVIRFVYDVGLGATVEVHVPTIGVAGPWHIYDIDLPLDPWLGNFGTLQLIIFAGATLSQSLTPPATTDKFSFYLKTDFDCQDPVTGLIEKKVLYSFPTKTDPNHATCSRTVDFSMWTSGGRSTAEAWVLESSPLGACSDGVYTILFAFAPAPDPDPLLIHKFVAGGDNEVSLCICAVDDDTEPHMVGAPVYSIVEGHVASGLFFDPATGCLEGTMDGVTSFSQFVTFRAIDRFGHEALKECVFFQTQGCPPGSDTGLGNYLL